MRLRRLVLPLVIALTVLVSGCGNGEAPSVDGGDPELVRGREVFVERCARCHGGSGGGGAGPRLSGGVVVRRYPDPEAQAQVVRNGRGAMPGFGNVLSPEDVNAVVRYTREAL
jgi:mono/diheme cytochrome c family protein